METKQEAQLNDWHYNGSSNVLFGVVQNHPKLGSGSSVRTSSVIRIYKSEEGKIFAETLNTVYELN